jgi:AraC-like DNA-binding protein
MAALVADSSKTVLDIALAVGSNSKSAFNAAFRQQTGMTPREYRNSQGLQSEAGH